MKENTSNKGKNISCFKLKLILGPSERNQISSRETNRQLLALSKESGACY